MLALLMIITLITIIYKMLLYSPSTRFVRTDFKDTVRHCSCDCDVGVVLNKKRIFIITTSLPLLQWVSSSITITFLLRKRGNHSLTHWVIIVDPILGIYGRDIGKDSIRQKESVRIKLKREDSHHHPPLREARY